MPDQPGTTDPSPGRWELGGRVWLVASVLTTAAVSLALMFLPTVRVATATDGTEQVSRESLVESQGWTVAAILTVPVLISAAPLLVPARHRRWATLGSAVLLAVGAAAGMASVGVFYGPSVALLAVAAAWMFVATARAGEQRTRRQR